MAKIVVALGGNALGKSPQEQLELVKNTAKSLVGLITKGHEIVISHGNGPQVGSINLGLNYAAEHNQGPAFPFAECGAMSQAYIGYQLQESLQNELHSIGMDKQVVTLVTQVEVDENDPAFNNPSKPIGLFYNKEEAEQIQISIIELESIKTLIKNDTLVIAAGGGGIPVIREQHDGFKGIDAVIDKDKTSALLGANIQCDQLIILTAIDYVYINFNTENQQPLKTTNVDELKRYIDENQFAKGSMLPKIEAAISFIENNPKGSVLITSLNELDAALEGKVGTVIKK
ncbi:TPA: carbamate kinase [Staphylococcus aureus]|nr:carbamate kinase [Staphylococcus aureus]